MYPPAPRSQHSALGLICRTQQHTPWPALSLLNRHLLALYSSHGAPSPIPCLPFSFLPQSVPGALPPPRKPASVWSPLRLSVHFIFSAMSFLVLPYKRASQILPHACLSSVLAPPITWNPVIICYFVPNQPPSSFHCPTFTSTLVLQTSVSLLYSRLCPQRIKQEPQTQEAAINQHVLSE